MRMTNGLFPVPTFLPIVVTAEAKAGQDVTPTCIFQYNRILKTKEPSLQRP